MSLKGGYFGKLLRINLTNRTSTVEDLDPAFLKKYVGGAMLGTKILYDETRPGIDALGEENKLIYTIGPLTGTDCPTASRMNIATKSPLTGAICNSLSGGFFPVEMKWAGWDVIIIEGKADEPVYILIKDDKVEIRKAEKYWGLNTFDTQNYLKEDLHDLNIRISCIGPAGENLSLLSSIANEARVCGRKGVGAVMGSKNLKAVAIRGSNKVPIADQEKFKAAIREQLHEFKESHIAYPVFSKTGSTCGIENASGLGFFPIKNWMDTGVVDVSDTLGSKVFLTQVQKGNPCYKCPIDCAKVRMVKKGRYAGISSEGPEFETVYSLGSTLGIYNSDFVIAADRLCDELGMDTIGAGVTIGMAMELYEKGILTDTEGLDLSWGNEEVVLQLLRMMAYKEGLGKLLSDGTRKFAQAIGNGADYYAMQVKGLEIPGYDVRGLKSHGLNMATSYTGADHNRGYAFQEIFGIPFPHAVERLAIEGKGALTKWNQDFCGTYDVVTLCEFPTQMALSGTAQRIVAGLLTGATGIDYTEEEVWELGDRLNNVCRMYNVREGFSRKDDYLPRRIQEEPIKEGLSKGEVISKEDNDFMLDEYYEVRGWDKNGIPTPGKLIELGLEDTIKDLPASN